MADSSSCSHAEPLPILVTGAFGNLGQSVLLALRSQRKRVRAFDLPSTKNRAVAAKFPDIEVVWGDITRRGDVARAAQRIAGVAHLAAVLPPLAERKPELTRAVNVEGTRLLIEEVERAVGCVPFVFASSFSVYGPSAATRGFASGSSPTEASDTYTETKLAAEASLQKSQLSWVILRIGAAVEASAGATDPIVLRLMFEVDPENPIELVHGADVARAVVRALDVPEAYRKVLPIGGGQSCQINQRRLLEETLFVIGVRNLPRSVHGRAPYYTCWLDTGESQRLLDFQHHDLSDILRDLEKRFALLKPFRFLVGPLLRLVLLQFSGPFRKQPERSTLRSLIDAGY